MVTSQPGSFVATSTTSVWPSASKASMLVVFSVSGWAVNAWVDVVGRVFVSTRVTGVGGYQDGSVVAGSVFAGFLGAESVRTMSPSIKGAVSRP